MSLRSLSVAVGFLVACAPAPLACARQQPTAPATPSQKQFDALREQVSAMQKDLDEIKALLAPLRKPPLPAALDLGSRPIRGESTAKLTFVELTDYQ